MRGAILGGGVRLDDLQLLHGLAVGQGHLAGLCYGLRLVDAPAYARVGDERGVGVDVVDFVFIEYGEGPRDCRVAKRNQQGDPSDNPEQAARLADIISPWRILRASGAARPVGG